MEPGKALLEFWDWHQSLPQEEKFVSVRAFCMCLGIDYDAEIERLKSEKT